MKHKTLFRVLLKLLGVWMFLGGVTGAIQDAVQVVGFLYRPAGFAGAMPWYAWVGFSSGPVSIFLGLYLFFGGEWIVNKAIPSNRPYCGDCGYDLSKNTASYCPECGATAPRDEGSESRFEHAASGLRPHAGGDPAAPE